MTTALEGREGSASSPGRYVPSGKTRYSLYRRLGRPQGRSQQERKILPPHPTGIRSPVRPARSSVAIPTELRGPQSRRKSQEINTEILIDKCNGKLQFVRPEKKREIDFDELIHLQAREFVLLFPTVLSVFDSV